MFINPAGLAEGKDNVSAVFGKQTLFNLNYFNHVYAGVKLKVPYFGVIGFSLDNLATKYKSRNLADEQSLGIHQGFFLQEDDNSSLALGYSLNSYTIDYGRSAGTNGDGTNGLDLGKHQTFGLSFGLQATLREKIKFGAKVNNLNRPSIGEANNESYLPRRLQIGLAYSPYDLVWTTLALNHSVGFPSQVQTGLHYKIYKNFHLSSGIQTNPNRFSAGTSFIFKSIKIDYAFITHPILSVTQQLSIEVIRK